MHPQATVLDMEEECNPFDTGCDAYVLTDRGIHLFFVLAKSCATRQIKCTSDLSSKSVFGGSLRYLGLDDARLPSIILPKLK